MIKVAHERFSMSHEIEIKLKIEDMDEEIQKIRNLGANLIDDFEFEDNFIFDQKDQSLKKKESVLRIRKYGSKNTVTLKEKIPGESKYKERYELEMEMEDPGTLKELFQKLGFQVVYRYQKYRAAFKWGNLRIYCDKTPIGDFLELEGKKEEIDEAALKLGHDQDDYINVSYLTYHLEYLESKGLPIQDMLFKNKK